MSNAFFISDTHWGHRNILKYRPEFVSIEDHDHTILDGILRRITKRDVVWLLGDCFFDEPSLYFLREIDRKCAHVNMVLGNHDTDSGERLETMRMIIRDRLVNKFGSLFKYHEFWLSHQPIHPAELRKAVNIHGHVHRETIPDPNYINVCCENVRYRAISIGELRELNTTRHLVNYGYRLEHMA